MSQTVLVTGASSGIGAATARLFHARGFTVFGTTRAANPVSPPEFTMLALDVTSDDSVRDCIDRVLSQTGRLDVLVNNAGYVLNGAIEETSLAEAKDQFETNFFGCVRTVNAVLPSMRQARAGRIINIGSLVGLIAVPYSAYYCATKFALEAYSESLWYEIRPFGIGVSLIEPGYIRTSISHAARTAVGLLPAYEGPRNRVTAADQRRSRKRLLAGTRRQGRPPRCQQPQSPPPLPRRLRCNLAPAPEKSRSLEYFRVRAPPPVRSRRKSLTTQEGDTAMNNELETFLSFWNHEAKQDRRPPACALPAGQYDFRPDPQARSLGELAWHLAEVDAYTDVGHRAGRTCSPTCRPPGIERPSIRWKPSRPATNAFIPKPAERISRAHSNRPRPEGSASFTGKEMPIRDILLWCAVLFHMIHHRGQLSILVPARGRRSSVELYGPNREEMAALRAART